MGLPFGGDCVLAGFGPVGHGAVVLAGRRDGGVEIHETGVRGFLEGLFRDPRFGFATAAFHALPVGVGEGGGPFRVGLARAERGLDGRGVRIRGHAAAVEPARQGVVVPPGGGVALRRHVHGRSEGVHPAFRGRDVDVPFHCGGKRKTVGEVRFRGVFGGGADDVRCGPDGGGVRLLGVPVAAGADCPGKVVQALPGGPLGVAGGRRRGAGAAGRLVSPHPDGRRAGNELGTAHAGDDGVLRL